MQEDIKALPAYVPATHTFSLQRVAVNPLLAEVITNPETSLKRQDSYNTYKLLAASLDKLLIKSIQQGIEVIEDRVIASCRPCLSGELRFAPIFIDVSSLNISIEALKRAYLLTAGRARLNLLKQQNHSDSQLASTMNYLNSCLLELNGSNWRSTAMRQLAVLRQIHVASDGYFEYLGERPTSTSILVSMAQLKSIYGPEAILSEIRKHLDPSTNTSTQVLVRTGDNTIPQSKIQLNNLMRFTNIHPELRAINLLPNLGSEGRLMTGLSAAALAPNAPYDSNSNLYDVLVLRELSRQSNTAPVLRAGSSTPEQRPGAGVRDVFNSLSELSRMLPSVEEKGDLNTYEDVDIPEDSLPSGYNKSDVKETTESMLTPRSTRQESGNECSDEEEYPNTAIGKLRAEQFIQCVVQEMYTEFYNANPDGCRPDSSMEC